MRFGVLGPVAVWSDDGSPIEIPEAKVRTILGCLLAQHPEPVSSDRLADVLWGDEQPRDPRGAVQRKIWQLRRVLEQAEAGGRDLVAHRTGGYLLRIELARLDAARFRALVRRAEAAAGAERLAALDEALGLWRGPAFADSADSEVVHPVAVGLSEERSSALELRAETGLELGRYAAVADELSGLVRQHPFRERLRAAYLRALYRAGRQREALQDYERYRRSLAEEFGQDPGAELTALHAEILRHDMPSGPSTPSAPAAPAASPTPAGAPTAAESSVPAADPSVPAPADRPGVGVPAPLTGLVGREQAIDRIIELLSSARLVTLTGPGGVGKTRLATEVARLLTPDSPGGSADTERGGTAFPGGIELVELAEYARSGADASVLVEIVASVLGLREDPPPASAAPNPSWAPNPDVAPESAAETVRTEPGNPYRALTTGPVWQKLVHALNARRPLLLLDNCEHVLDPVADLVAELLRAVPGLRILATSRAPLGLDGETHWPVAPLDLPDAVRLFTARALAADPHARLGDPDSDIAEQRADHDALRAVCQRLDGIPLALELAATRVRALGIRELSRRLDDRFALLAGGRRGLPGRQQTLRAVIDWSWELLCPCDQTVLRRLAVFAGGCTLRAAEAVCVDDAVARGDVLDSLLHLVDWSLVVATDDTDESDPGGNASPRGERRYRLLESVQRYCLDRLAEAGDGGTALLARHWNHYVEFAEDIAPLLRGRDQSRAGRMLDAEYANLTTALENAARHGEAEVALRIANALAWYWVLRGKLTEGRRLLETALAVSDHDPSAGRERARALGWLGGIAGRLGDRTALRTYGDASLALYESLGAGGADSAGGNDDGTAEPTAETDELALEAARTEVFLALGGLAGGDNHRYDQRQDERALRIFTEQGDRWGIAAVLGIRASLAIAAGDLRAVERDGARSRELFTELGDGWGQLLAYQALVTAAEIAGDYERAEADTLAGLRLTEELGIHSETSYFLSSLGRIALLRGDLARSTELHERAISSAVEHGDTTAEGYAATGLALLARREGRFDQAEEILHRWLEWDRGWDWQPGMALSLAELGFVAEERGDAELAASRHREGLENARATGDPRAVALGLEGLAGAASLAGNHRRAARLLGAAEAARASVDAPLPVGERRDVDRIAGRIRAGIGDEAFEAERAVGARLGADADLDRFD